MKKTSCIHLVLITAALAGCDRPLYQQGGYNPYYDNGGNNNPSYGNNNPSYGMGELPDNSNSCPLMDSDLPPDYYNWYAGLDPYDYYYGNGFSLEGYYYYRYPATIVRAGFGRIGTPGHS